MWKWVIRWCWFDHQCVCVCVCVCVGVWEREREREREREHVWDGSANVWEQRTLTVGGRSIEWLVSSLNRFDLTKKKILFVVQSEAAEFKLVKHWRPAVQWYFPQQWVFIGGSMANEKIIAREREGWKSRFRGHSWREPSGQSYKHFTLVNYDSRVVIWGNFKSGTTLES